MKTHRYGQGYNRDGAGRERGRAGTGQGQGRDRAGTGHGQGRDRDRAGSQGYGCCYYSCQKRETGGTKKQTKERKKESRAGRHGPAWDRRARTRTRQGLGQGRDVMWCVWSLWCGVVVWCGVVWRGVLWCGGWCGVVWCGVVWCGVVWCGVVWCGVVWCVVVSGTGECAHVSQK
jgi:hypothetical protein